MPRARAEGKRRKGVRNLGRRHAQRRRARLAKLPLVAISPKRANGRDRMSARGDDVVPAIAPHAAIASVQFSALENVGDQIALVLVASVEFRAVNALEMALKIEVTQDAVCVDAWLGRAEEQPRPSRAEVRQGFPDAIVDDGVEQSGKALAELARDPDAAVRDCERKARDGRQQGRIDVDEGPLTREDESCPRQPEAVADRGEDGHLSDPARVDGDDSAAQPRHLDSREAGGGLQAPVQFRAELS